MAEMNELLEQAAAEANDLAGDATEASQAVQALLAKAGALKDEVRGRGTQARQALASLEEVLGAAQGAVVAARGRADSSLANVAQRAGAVREDVAALLARVKGSLEELDAQKGRLVDAVDDEAEALEGAVGVLTTHVNDAAESLNRQLLTAAATIDALRSAVDAARAGFAGKKGEWDHAVEALEAEVLEQSHNWVDGVQKLLADQATALVDLTNDVVDAHNTAMDDLKEKFTMDAPVAVVMALRGLTAELVSLGQNASEEQDALSSQSEQVLAKVREALPLLERLATALDTATERL